MPIITNPSPITPASSSGCGIVHGSTPFRMEGEQLNDLPDGTLDTGSVKFLTSFDGYKSALSSLGVQKGYAYGALSGMWVRDVKRTREGDDLAICDVSLEGVLAANGEKRQRRMNVFGNIISLGPIQQTHIVVEDDPDEAGETIRRRVPKVDSEGDPVYVIINTPSGSGDRWNVFSPQITVMDTYFSTSPPSMSQVGASLTPPSAPAVPGNPFSSTQVPQRRSTPNGWVLTSRDPEQLYGYTIGGSGLWKVIDVYDYFFTAVPD